MRYKILLVTPFAKAKYLREQENISIFVNRRSEAPEITEDHTIIDSNLTSPDEIFGTENEDYITGGVDANILYGLAGDDIIKSGGGDDIVYAGAGNDYVKGNGGNDVLYASEDAGG